MKILITTDSYGTMINGVAVSVHNLSSSLKEAGHDVRILTLSQNHHSYQDGEVYYIRSVPFKIYPDTRATLSFGDSLLDDILAWKPDIIHSQSEFFTFIFARRISRMLDVPIVHTYHTLYEYYTHYFCPSKKIGKKIVSIGTRLICNKADAVIAPTEKTAQILQNYSVDSPTNVIPTGLDLKRFELHNNVDLCQELRTELQIPLDAPVIMTLGRLAREKNVEFLIRQMTDSRIQELGVHLLIVGDGPDRERLEDLVSALHLQDSVHFTGMVPPEEVAMYYQLGNIFVSASSSETQGLTYIEAMACGLPLLCLRDMCLESVLIPGYNGFFFENGTDFTEQLTTMLQSPKLLENYSRNALQTSSLFSKEAFAHKALRFYQKTIIDRKEKQTCTRFACIQKPIWPRGTGF